MNTSKILQLIGTIIVLLATALPECEAQSINLWRGDETGANWNNAYKWKLKHPPSGMEAVHFREANSVVTLNRTVDLNNGIQLYGEELILKGSGNINLNHPVPHQRTINIPATATGRASLTMNQSVSLNGRVALAAKAFGTSASKGTLTLKNQTTVTGPLCIGNNGCGTGKVIVRDKAVFNITGLELATLANAGGSAEIHAEGGTVRIESKKNPFSAFFEDSSRKIILGDMGTLKVETAMDFDQLVNQLKVMILHGRLVAAAGCRLKTPVLDENTILIQAEDERNDSKIKTKKQLLAAIDRQAADKKTIIVAARRAKEEAVAKAKLEALLLAEQSSATNQQAVAKAEKPNTRKAADAEGKSGMTPTRTAAGYLVVFGSFLLMFRRPEQD